MKYKLLLKINYLKYLTNEFECFGRRSCLQICQLTWIMTCRSLNVQCKQNYSKNFDTFQLHENIVYSKLLTRYEFLLTLRCISVQMIRSFSFQVIHVDAQSANDVTIF